MEFLTSENFDQKISSGIVLIDFFANWCGPCKMISPVLESVAEKYADKISVYKVDVDEYPELAQRFDVFSIPNLLIFKDGKQFDQMIGFNGPDALESFVNKAL